MTTEYTPTTDDVRAAWMVDAFDPDGDPFGGIAARAWDRWIAAHNREIAARAIESAANHVHGIHPSPFEQITAYAQKIREGDAVRQWGSD